MQAFTVMDQHVYISVGKLAEVKIGVGSPKSKLWIRCETKWVSTVTTGPGQTKYLKMTNVSDREIILNQKAPLGWWMAADMIPRTPGVCVSWMSKVL